MENNDLKKIYDNPLYIRYIKNPSVELILEAVKKNGLAIRYIENPTNEMKETAIKNNPLAVEYIEELSEENAILAVRLLWNSLKYIKNPSEKVKFEAINAKGWAIQFIADPSEEVQIKAVSKDYDAIKYIKNPSAKVQIDFNLDELRILIGDNIKIVKYVYDSIDVDFVVNVVIEKVKEDLIDESYIKDFLELEILEMDKVNFIREYGSKKAKILLVDYKLSR